VRVQFSDDSSFIHAIALSYISGELLAEVLADDLLGDSLVVEGAAVFEGSWMVSDSQKEEKQQQQEVVMRWIHARQSSSSSYSRGRKILRLGRGDAWSFLRQQVAATAVAIRKGEENGDSRAEEQHPNNSSSRAAVVNR
jgi:hypothetical protein